MRPETIARSLLTLVLITTTLCGLNSCTTPGEPVQTRPVPESNQIAPVASALKLQQGTDLVFARVEQARKRLATRDTFIKTVSPFDRAARLKTDQDVSVSQFLEHIKNQVRPWTDDEKRRIAAAVGPVTGKLASFKLNLPEKILLIKTTGAEEGGATYTRAGAIVVSQGRLDREKPNLERAIIHELFHVLTSHNPQLKEALYEIINFKKCNEIELPLSLRNIRITNPDGPLNDHYVEVQHNLQAVPVVPIIYSSAEKYDVEKGGQFFRYIIIRLLVIEESNGRWHYKRSADGQPVLLEVKNVPDYFAKIGANTNYIIHPEEILAENFVLLVNDARNVRSKWVIEKMKSLLLSSAQNLQEE